MFVYPRHFLHHKPHTLDGIQNCAVTRPVKPLEFIFCQIVVNNRWSLTQSLSMHENWISMDILKEPQLLIQQINLPTSVHGGFRWKDIRSSNTRARHFTTYYLSRRIFHSWNLISVAIFFRLSTKTCSRLQLADQKVTPYSNNL